MKSLLGVLVILGMAHFNAHASENPRTEFMPEANVISVSGTGQIQAVPDMAVVEMSVITRAPTAKEAQSLNAEQTRNLKDTLIARFNFDSAEVYTVSYTVSPEYQVGPDKDRILSGYVAVHALAVKINHLQIIGDVLDTAGAEGASALYIQFGLKNQKEYELEALKAAMGDAFVKAEAIAGVTGRRVSRVRSVSQAGYQVDSERREIHKDAGAPTEVTPGAVVITATLVVEYEF